MNPDNFIKSLLKADGAISSKRFTAMIALVLYTAIVVCSLCGIQINSEVYYGTLGLIVSALGLTSFTKTS